MNPQDRFWLRTMKELYAMAHPTPLNAIEQAALLPLLARYANLDQEDNWWAAVPVLREDGSAVVAPLYLDRVDQLAANYWDGIRIPYFSVKP